MKVTLLGLQSVLPVIGIAVLMGGRAAGGAAPSAAAPCMAVLDRFTASDVPAQYQFASAPQCCTRLSARLANGNTIFTSRGDNGKGPQLIEVTPDKKVVWVLQDWNDLASSTALQILDDPDIPETAGESEH